MALDTSKFNGVIAKETLGAEFYDDLIASSTVFSLGRKLGTISSGKASIAVPESLISAGFVGVAGEKPVGGGDIQAKELNAGKIAAIVLVPEEYVNDANFDIFNEYVKRYAPEAFGAALDKAALFGTGAPSDWTGIQDGLVEQATAKGNVVTATDDIYQDIMGKNGLIQKVNEDGFRVTGWAGDPSVEADLRSAVDGNNRPIYLPYTDPLTSAPKDTIYGRPYHSNLNGAWDSTKASLIGGDFTKLVYAIREDINYRISTDAIVKLADGTEVNCFQQNVVAFLMEMRVAAGVLNPATAKNPSAATRFPFAILKNS
jgi:HK97 family phage major capsid protein